MVEVGKKINVGKKKDVRLWKEEENGVWSGKSVGSLREVERVDKEVKIGKRIEEGVEDRGNKGMKKWKDEKLEEWNDGRTRSYKKLSNVNESGTEWNLHSGVPDRVSKNMLPSGKTSPLVRRRSKTKMAKGVLMVMILRGRSSVVVPTISHSTSSR